MNDRISASLAAIDIDQKIKVMESTCQNILELAKRHGADSAEVGVSSDFGLSVQVRNQDVETVEFNQDGSFGITVYFGQKKGSSSTTDVSQSALEDAVSAACNIAKYTAPDPFSGLADKSLMATDFIDLKMDHPADVEVESMINQALECEAAALNVSSQIKSDGSSISAHRFARVYANSNDFIGHQASSRYSLSAVAIAQQANDMQRDYWYSLSRQFELLEAASNIGKIAAERAQSRLNAKILKTGKVPVCFSPDIARGIFGHLFSAISGGALYRKSSFLLDSLGQKILPEFISIDERPHLLNGLSSAYFDNEGVATKPRHIVEQGVLQGYILSSYSAKRLNTQTTGNAGGLHNVFISHSDLSQQDLLNQMDTGLFVTEVMGQGVNLVTGDYSRGVAGFWVEGGKIQYPVHEITIASNLKDMFNNIQVVGNDLDMRSSVVTGSILIDAMIVAGS